MGDVLRILILGGLGAKGEELGFHSEGLLCSGPGLDPMATKMGTCPPPHPPGPWFPPLQIPPGKILSELCEIILSFTQSFSQSLFFEHLLCAGH